MEFLHADTTLTSIYDQIQKNVVTQSIEDDSYSGICVRVDRDHCLVHPNNWVTLNSLQAVVINLDQSVAVQLRNQAIEAAFDYMYGMYPYTCIHTHSMFI